MNRLLYKTLLLFTSLATLGGILTLVPWKNASYPNILGYSSLCTFAPAATLYCFFIAGFSCFIRSTFVKEERGTAAQKFKKHRQSLIPLGLVFVSALVVTFSFIQIKQTYQDGTSAVSDVWED